jgi:hypothetical protein
MGNPAVRAGIRYGLIIAVIGLILQVIVIFVTRAVGDPGHIADKQAAQDFLLKVAPYLLLAAGASIVALIADIVLCVLAGRGAARLTGTVSSGALAGLVTGLVSEFIGLVISVALSAAGVSTTPRIPIVDRATSAVTIQVPPTTSSILTNGIVSLIVISLLAAGVGALGGLIGRGAYQNAQSAAMPTGYPQQPMQ